MEAECTECWQSFNNPIYQAAVEYNIPVISTYQLFNGLNGEEDPLEKGYLGSDRIHPSIEGTTAIAQQVREAGYEPVSQP